MTGKFEVCLPEAITRNPFRMIGTDWMLVSAGDRTAYNTLTASWGGLGVLWHKNTATIFVRPSRFTFTFLEKFDHFSLSFFTDSYRDVLTFCGTKSGRDYNKVEETGLTPSFSEAAPYFQEAQQVLICKKIYTHDLNPDAFLDSAINKHYAKQDYHRMYVGEIVQVLQKEDTQEEND